MNNLGMVVDTAHMSHESMMDVLSCAPSPVLNSHSNLKHFCPHTRNVEDDFLKALADNGGVL
jgi:membrane dipeptidase